LRENFGLIGRFIRSFVFITMTLSIPEQSYPYRSTAKQSIRDHEMAAKEANELGPEFTVMWHRLYHYPKRDLANIAVSLGAGTTLPKLGRLAPRLRAAMVVWFCRYAPDFAGAPVRAPAAPEPTKTVVEPAQPDIQANGYQWLEVEWVESAEWDDYANDF
jgi:hypothetical protein